MAWRPGSTGMPAASGARGTAAPSTSTRVPAGPADESFTVRCGIPRLDGGGAILEGRDALVAGRERRDARPPVLGRGHELALLLLALPEVEQGARALHEVEAPVELGAGHRVVALLQGRAAFGEERLRPGPWPGLRRRREATRGTQRPALRRGSARARRHEVTTSSGDRCSAPRSALARRRAWGGCRGARRRGARGRLDDAEGAGRGPELATGRSGRGRRRRTAAPPPEATLGLHASGWAAVAGPARDCGRERRRRRSTAAARPPQARRRRRSPSCRGPGAPRWRSARCELASALALHGPDGELRRGHRRPRRRASRTSSPAPRSRAKRTAARIARRVGPASFCSKASARSTMAATAGGDVGRDGCERAAPACVIAARRSLSTLSASCTSRPGEEREHRRADRPEVGPARRPPPSGRAPARAA